ncbi:MAG: DUF2905 domain-containing protein, partial [Betaproteobacteria bacterium]
MPGDIFSNIEGVRCFFSVVTCIVINIAA